MLFYGKNKELFEKYYAIIFNIVHEITVNKFTFSLIYDNISISPYRRS